MRPLALRGLDLAGLHERRFEGVAQVPDGLIEGSQRGSWGRNVPSYTFRLGCPKLGA